MMRKPPFSYHNSKLIQFLHALSVQKCPVVDERAAKAYRTPSPARKVHVRPTIGSGDNSRSA
jgi:hypothetical protein